MGLCYAEAEQQKHRHQNHKTKMITGNRKHVPKLKASPMRKGINGQKKIITTQH